MCHFANCLLVPVWLSGSWMKLSFGLRLWPLEHRCLRDNFVAAIRELIFRGFRKFGCRHYQQSAEDRLRKNRNSNLSSEALTNQFPYCYYQRVSCDYTHAVILAQVLSKKGWRCGHSLSLGVFRCCRYGTSWTGDEVHVSIFAESLYSLKLF